MLTAAQLCHLGSPFLLFLFLLYVLQRLLMASSSGRPFMLSSQLKGRLLLKDHRDPTNKTINCLLEVGKMDKQISE